MPTRNVVLTDHQTELVERLVASGRYQNASEVLREGLRLLEGREAEEKVRLAALREAARIGIADIEAGRFRTFESAAALNRHLPRLPTRRSPEKPPEHAPGELGDAALAGTLSPRPPRPISRTSCAGRWITSAGHRRSSMPRRLPRRWSRSPPVRQSLARGPAMTSRRDCSHCMLPAVAARVVTSCMFRLGHDRDAEVIEVLRSSMMRWTCRVICHRLTSANECPKVGLPSNGF